MPLDTLDLEERSASIVFNESGWVRHYFENSVRRKSYIYYMYFRDLYLHTTCIKHNEL